MLLSVAHLILFVYKSLVIHIYGMNSDNEFVNTLEDEVRNFGAMDLLISDSAKVETSGRVNDLLRAYRIRDWQSEPNYQHQNFSERRWQDLRKNTN